MDNVNHNVNEHQGMLGSIYKMQSFANIGIQAEQTS